LYERGGESLLIVFEYLFPAGLFDDDVLANLLRVRQKLS
jgi:hypothetical protein